MAHPKMRADGIGESLKCITCAALVLVAVYVVGSFLADGVVAASRYWSGGSAGPSRPSGRSSRATARAWALRRCRLARSAAASRAARSSDGDAFSAIGHGLARADAP